METNDRVEKSQMELILEVLPHLILGNAEELHNNPGGEMAKNTISEMQRVIRETHQEILTTHTQEIATDIIKMADAFELECGKDGDKGTKQWMAFKGFRNAIRDKYLLVKKE